jgi:hypothetical protein
MTSENADLCTIMEGDHADIMERAHSGNTCARVGIVPCSIDSDMLSCGHGISVAISRPDCSQHGLEDRQGPCAGSRNPWLRSGRAGGPPGGLDRPQPSLVRGLERSRRPGRSHQHHPPDHGGDADPAAQPCHAGAPGADPGSHLARSYCRIGHAPNAWRASQSIANWSPCC